MDDIPAFLLLTAEERREAWRGRKLTKLKFANVKITRNEDASTKAFRRQMEKEEKEKQKLKFKLLRERYGKKR